MPSVSVAGLSLNVPARQGDAPRLRALRIALWMAVGASIICLLAMREGFVPPNAPIETPDPVCTFDLVRTPRDADLDCVLTNSFGFGGANATLVMRRMEE